MFNVESEAGAGRDLRGRGSRWAASRRWRCGSIPTSTPRRTPRRRPARRGTSSAWTSSAHDELAAKVLADPHLELRGIHMHLGSPILTTEPYDAAAQKAIEVVRDAARSRARDELDQSRRRLRPQLPRRTKHRRRASTPKVIVPCVKEAELPAGTRTGPLSSAATPGILLSAGDLHQARRGQAVRHPGRGDERPRPAGDVRLVPSHLAGAARGRRARRTTRREIPGCEPADVVGPICESGDYLAKGRCAAAGRSAATCCARSAPGPTAPR